MIEEERDSILEAIRRKSAAIRDVPIDSLVRRDLDPDLAFTEYAAEFGRMRELAGRVLACNLDALPRIVASDAVTRLEAMMQGIAALQQFSVRQAADQGRNLKSSRDQVARTFVERYDDFARGLTHLFAYCGAAQGTDALDRMRTELEPLQQQITAARERAQQQLAEISQLVELARAGTQSVGVAQHARHFKDEATRHERYAWLWLSVTVLLGLSVSALAVHNLDLVLDGAAPATGPAAASFIVAKLLLFSVVASATLWSGRVYRAHQHNAVVNRHRQNALSSFEAFVASTEDVGTRNAVLVQATQSIFAPQHSGFSATESDPVVGASFADIAKNLPGSGKP